MLVGECGLSYMDWDNERKAYDDLTHSATSADTTISADAVPNTQRAPIGIRIKVCYLLACGWIRTCEERMSKVKKPELGFDVIIGMDWLAIVPALTVFKTEKVIRIPYGDEATVKKRHCIEKHAPCKDDCPLGAASNSMQDGLHIDRNLQERHAFGDVFRPGPVWGCDRLVSRAKVIENQVMAISVILVSSDSSEDSAGTPARRVILFGTIPTAIPDTTPVITPPTTQTDTTVIPIETPIITPTIPPSPDYTPASPYYSPASDSESDLSKDPSSDHIPPLPAILAFLSSTNDTIDNESSEQSRSRGTDIEVDNDVERSDGMDIDPVKAIIKACFDFADIIRASGVDVRVETVTVARDDVETCTRDPIVVSDDDDTPPVVPEVTPEPAQKGAVGSTYKTFKDLVQRFYDHTEAIPVHRIQVIEGVQREQGHRIVRVESTVTALKAGKWEGCSEDSFEPYVPREVGLGVDIEDESFEQFRSRGTDIEVDDDVERISGVDVRVEAMTVARDDVETGTRDPIVVSDDRDTPSVVPEVTPEPAQEGTAGRVQREQGHRIVGIESAVTALTERIAELERDNRRLKGTTSVES
ncbi:hypothetical protein Tco_0875001 [Tanacetum coccineum]|uniref:Uncharacterized protein n=1 Tax=Tanacetum coccineum TaxID=301880 RepID=A0ABQ5BNE1_9ASTR